MTVHRSKQPPTRLRGFGLSRLPLPPTPTISTQPYSAMLIPIREAARAKISAWGLAGRKTWAI